VLHTRRPHQTLEMGMEKGTEKGKEERHALGGACVCVCEELKHT